VDADLFKLLEAALVHPLRRHRARNPCNPEANCDADMTNIGRQSLSSPLVAVAWA